MCTLLAKTQNEGNLFLSLGHDNFILSICFHFPERFMFEISLELSKVPLCICTARSGVDQHLGWVYFPVLKFSHESMQSLIQKQ